MISDDEINKSEERLIHGERQHTNDFTLAVLHRLRSAEEALNTIRTQPERLGYVAAQESDILHKECWDLANSHFQRLGEK